MAPVLPFPSFPPLPSYQWARAESGGQKKSERPGPSPTPNPSHSSDHWSFERLLSVALVPLTVTPFNAGSIHPVTDAALGAALVLHSHIAFQYFSPCSSNPSAPLASGGATGLE